MNLKDLSNDNVLILQHRPWQYDYIHKLELNFEDNTFETTIGGGQCIESVYTGEFKCSETILELKFTNEIPVDAMFSNKSVISSPINASIRSRYTITEVNHKQFCGYSMYLCRYEIKFNRDPFYYGERKPTLFNMIDREGFERDTNIFYAGVSTIKCNTGLESYKASLNQLSYDTVLTVLKEDSVDFGFDMPKEYNVKFDRAV
jgi:hypothetical protein